MFGSFGQGSLRLHRALNGVNGACELGKDTVARRIRYAAPVFPNDRVKDRAPFSQPFQRTDLVNAHEAAVAFDIRCEDCDEASADIRSVGHACPNAHLWPPVWAEGGHSSTLVAPTSYAIARAKVVTP
jgi:hypothetical protein